MLFQLLLFILALPLSGAHAVAQSPFKDHSAAYKNLLDDSAPPEAIGSLPNMPMPDLCTASGMSERAQQIAFADMNVRLQAAKERLAKQKPGDKSPAAVPSYGTFAPINAESSIDAQIALSQALATIPPEQMSERFKALMVKKLVFWIAAYAQAKPGVKAMVPWPMNSPTGVVKMREVSEVMNALEHLPAETKTAIRAALAKDQSAFAIAARKTDAEIKTESDANMGAYQTADPDRVDDVKTAAYVRRAKQKLIEAIANGVDEKHQSEAQRRMIDRIKILKFVQTSYGCGSFFGYSTSEIKGCLSLPVTEAQATSQVIATMANVIDDCAMEQPVYKIHKEKLAQLPADAFTDPADQYTVKTCLYGAGTAPFVDQTCIGEASSTVINKLLKTGAVTVELPATPFTQLAEQPLRQCLSDELGVKAVSSRDIDAFAEKVSRLKSAQLGPSYNKAKGVAEIKEAYATAPSCFRSKFDDQMSSAFRQILVQRAMTADLKVAATSNSKDEIVRALSFLRINLPTDSSQQKDKSSMTAAEVISAASVDVNNLDTRQISSELAFNQIVLLNNDVRKALGCPMPTQRLKCASAIKNSVNRSGSVK